MQAVAGEGGEASGGDIIVSSGASTAGSSGQVFLCSSDGPASGDVRISCGAVGPSPSRGNGLCANTRAARVAGSIQIMSGSSSAIDAGAMRALAGCSLASNETGGEVSIFVERSLTGGPLLGWQRAQHR